MPAGHVGLGGAHSDGPLEIGPHHLGRREGEILDVGQEPDRLALAGIEPGGPLGQAQGAGRGGIGRDGGPVSIGELETQSGSQPSQRLGMGRVEANRLLEKANRFGNTFGSPPAERLLARQERGMGSFPAGPGGRGSRRQPGSGAEQGMGDPGHYVVHHVVEVQGIGGVGHHPELGQAAGLDELDRYPQPAGDRAGLEHHQVLHPKLLAYLAQGGSRAAAEQRRSGHVVDHGEAGHLAEIVADVIHQVGQHGVAGGIVLVVLGGDQGHRGHVALAQPGRAASGPTEQA